jgi:ABC-type transport system involved in multi-copper enzyme maturation permease subunit
VSGVSIWRARWHAALAIQRRDLRASAYGFGPYVITSASIAVAAAILQTRIRSAQDAGLYVLSNPLAMPLFGTTFLSSVYLALSSAVSIARERNRGTLEVLFYGPVDAVAYLLGKYLAQMSVFALMTAVYLVALWVYALVANLPFDLNVLWAAVLSAATASAVVAIGMLLSTFKRSARGAPLALLAVVLLFLGIQVGHDYVFGLAGGIARWGPGPILFWQTVLGWLDQGIRWLSPFALLARGIDALLQGIIGECLFMGALLLLYTAVALWLAAWSLRRKGVP